MLPRSSYALCGRVALSIALAAALVSGCASSGPRNAWDVSQAAQLPNDRVNLLRQDNGVAATLSHSQIRQMLDIEQRVQSAAGVSALLYVAEMNQPNAFAVAKDGVNYVVVTIPMVDLLGADPNQWAALFGHELGHVVKGHQSASESRGAVLEVMQFAAGIALGLAHAPVGSGYLVDFGAGAINAKFSRDQEREADALSIGYMRATGFDPHGAVRLQQTLLASAHGVSIPFLESHPSGQERIRNLQALIDQGTPTTDGTRTETAPTEAPAWLLEWRREHSRNSF